jgi:hypothetical protein
MKNVMETVSGKFIDVTNPDPKDIILEDIAWALSRIPRFCGASISYIPYSVAQHSVNVAKYVAREYPNDSQLIACALFHDAHEYIIGDIPSPVKHLPYVHAAILEVENRIDAAIREAFGIKHKPEYDKIIKAADMRARKIEAYTFMYSRGNNWPNLPQVTLIELQNFEEPKTCLDAYTEFMQYANMLEF